MNIGIYITCRRHITIEQYQCRQMKYLLTATHCFANAKRISNITKHNIQISFDRVGIAIKPAPSAIRVVKTECSHFIAFRKKCLHQ